MNRHAAANGPLEALVCLVLGLSLLLAALPALLAWIAP